MEYGRIAGIDKPVSRLIQGTVMLRADDEAGAFALLDAVLEQGGTALDTARSYGGGEIEPIVGRWLRDRGVRDQVVIVAKGAHHSAERKRVTPEDITSDLETSLEAFGVERLDLYLLHRDDPKVPVESIMAVLDGHRRAGKIAAYGGSNWTIARIEEANAFAAANGMAPFVASSPHFSLAEQVEPPWRDCVTITAAENEDARAWYQENQMPVLAWSSLAGGFFSGRLTPEVPPEGEDAAAALCRSSYGSPANFDRLERARTLAAERGLSGAQVALAWVLAQPMNLFPLVGSRDGAEFAENAAAVAVRLTAAEVAWLNLEAESRD